MKSILLTGATGLLGSHLLKLFLMDGEYRIFLLVRGANQCEAENRVARLLSKINPDATGGKKNINKIKVMCGDIIKEKLGIEKEEYEFLTNNINEIFHCAALAEFRQPLEKVRLVNVGGTQNVLDFAMKCHNLEKVHYISTAFIAGTFKGRFSEQDFDVQQGFNNTYEQSKFEAELLVRKYFNSKFSISIYRPSIIVGEYDTGKTNNFRMFYQIFHSLALGIVKKIPVNRKTMLNIVPCDSAAKAIFSLSKDSEKNNTYHIASPKNLSMLKVMRFASKQIGYKEPEYVKLEKFSFMELSLLEKKLLGVYIPYLNFEVVFDSRMTVRKLRRVGFTYPDINNGFLFKLFAYSIEKRFMWKERGK